MDEINVIINDPHERLTAIFNKFAARAVSDFPHLKGRFALYSAETQTLHGSFAGERAGYLKEILQQDIAEGDAENAFAYAQRSTDGDYLIEHMGDLQSDDELADTLEHELGHLVAPGGIESEESDDRPYIFLECVADAFLYLRHYTDPERDHSGIDLRAFRRAVGLILNVAPKIGGESEKTSNFTLPVLSAIGKLTQKYDLKSLAADQAAKIAYRAAFLYTPSSKDLQKLEEIYAPAGQMHQHSLSCALQECAKIMFKDHGKDSPMVFMAGKAFLMPFLEQRNDILTPTIDFREVEELNLTGKFWDEVREEIQQRTDENKSLEQRLAQEARDMTALGRFDKNPDAEIDPAAYESKQNRAYLQKAQDVYAALRYLQETGQAMPLTGIDRGSLPVLKKLAEMDRLPSGRTEIIELACKLATENAPEARKPGWRGFLGR